MVFNTELKAVFHIRVLKKPSVKIEVQNSVSQREVFSFGLIFPQDSQNIPSVLVDFKI